MADFAKMLNDQMKKAAEASRGTEEPAGEGKPAPKSDAAKAVSKPPATEPAKVSPQPKEEIAPPKPAKQNKSLAPRGNGNANTNRVTVNLFEGDRRALAIIKEHLANAGLDFTNRSDSIKVGLRLAAKAKKEDLVQLLREVRAEDRRFGTAE